MITIQLKRWSALALTLFLLPLVVACDPKPVEEIEYGEEGKFETDHEEFMYFDDNAAYVYYMAWNHENQMTPYPVDFSSRNVRDVEMANVVCAAVKATNDGDVDVSGMLIVAFSTERFSPPIAEGDKDISTLREDDFERWVKRKSGASDAFQLERQPVRIRAKKKME